MNLVIGKYLSVYNTSYRSVYSSVTASIRQSSVGVAIPTEARLNLTHLRIIEPQSSFDDLTVSTTRVDAGKDHPY